ncbi:M56 family metallopeptidase [Zunongwangia sp. HRR-M8]|uniref:M56 family metallopeptidase n=1 Tax=Zunongwangia sp. HRR-M8 TaxID=3015170 RepID=UPI0022DE4C1A|nr:M56 family metallopeptidase [Zunongwangia sp. HRR-M8]WBL22802.1 energy transducer TonB [Zunongwangia sp. HRR-M8]
MLRYLLQIILFQLAFLLVYELFLKKETFFTANRCYLLLTPVLSLALPFASFSVFSEVLPASTVTAINNTIKLPEVFIGGNQPQVEQLPTVHIKAEKTTAINWWLVLYGLGSLISLLLFFKRWSVLGKLFQYKAEEKKDFRIIEIPNSRMAFTFLKTVFLGSEISVEERKQILAHELIHVSQKHSFDLLFFEMLKVLFWFNPLVYVFQNRIALLHEFIADEQVLKQTSKKHYFNQLLNSAFETQNFSFTNQFFNQSLIKKRIVMLQKTKSKTIAKFKFLLVVPVLAMMLIYVSCSDDRDVASQNPSNDIDNLISKIESRDDLTSDEKIQLVTQLKEVEDKMLGSNQKKDVVEVEPFNSSLGTDVPFSVIDEVPVFSDCEDLKTNEARKTCMSDKIAKFVASNFDTKIGEDLIEDGTIARILVQFKIDESGNIIDIKARGPLPELEEEAKRVVSEIPRMIPGKQRGKPAGVVYSLPIVFQKGGDTEGRVAEKVSDLPPPPPPASDDSK